MDYMPLFIYCLLAVFVLSTIGIGAFRLFKGYPVAHEFTQVEEKNPIICILPDGTTITKDSEHARVIELTGKDYTGLDDETFDYLSSCRKQFFDSLPSSISVLFQSHRQRMKQAIEVETYNNEMAGVIARKWAENFKESFRTRHFIVFVTDESGFLDQVAGFVDKKNKTGISEGLSQSLDDAVSSAMSRLSEYGPRLLNGDDLASYWAMLHNGRPVHQKLPKNGLVDGILAGTGLHWPKGERHQVYNSETQRFSSWLILLTPPIATDVNILHDLFKTSYELSLFQSFRRYEKATATFKVNDKRKNIQSFVRANDIIYLELQEIENRIQADEISLLSHRFALEVFADSIDELKETVSQVRSIIERHGYRVAIEGLNSEALHWAKFPSMQHLNCRKRELTSENASHFSTMPTVGEGHRRCSWGPHPVTTFKTIQGGNYDFIFHADPGRLAVGHTLMIGGTGKGKTTVTSFLLSQALKFKGMRIVAFDRLNGAQVFTDLHDGTYIDASSFKNLKMNPVQNVDSPATRVFLENWLMHLTGCNSPEHKKVIANAVHQAFSLPYDERCLKNLREAFGTPDPGSVAYFLQQWMPEGPKGGYFNADRDALNFDSSLVTFDMTTFLDSPDILTPLADYIIFKALQKIDLDPDFNSGFAFFFDEFPKFLRSEIFVPHIAFLLQEIRKKNGILIAATQTASSIAHHPLWETFKSNLATLILWPDPQADRAEYIDKFGLNETQFDFIRNGTSREILVVKIGGASVRLNVDLDPLGNLKNVFDSGRDAVKRLNAVRFKHANWKQDIINANAA